MKTFLLGSLSVLGLLVISYIRLTNPDLTETQLFLVHWPLWLLMATGVLGFLYGPDAILSIHKQFSKSWSTKE